MQVFSQNATLPVAFSVIDGVNERRDPVCHATFMISPHGVRPLSCTAVSRLIRALETRKTRARLDRLVRDGKIERKREQGTHGPVYLFRRLS